MLGQKNKNQPEQGRDRRRQTRYGDRSASPAFSYYASRPADTMPRRAVRHEADAQTTGKGHLPRLPLAQVPFWLLLAVVLVCAGKLLFLGTDPKVIILGESAATATYQQSTAAYGRAAHKLLASSITNRTKLTANVNGIAQELEHEFPEFQTVSLALPLIGNRPIVYVQIAQPSVVLQTPQGNFALNRTGIVLARLKSLPAHVPVMTDQSAQTPQVGKQYLPGSTIDFVQTIAYQFAAAKLPISAYVLPTGNPYELDVRLEGQPYVIKCNLQADALTQSGAAIATIRQLGQTVPGSYLDVRVPGRAYYK